jgi:hypothetical protein
VRGAIPPEPATVSEYALFAVPDKPLVGVEIAKLGGFVVTEAWELSEELL